MCVHSFFHFKINIKTLLFLRKMLTLGEVKEFHFPASPALSVKRIKGETLYCPKRKNIWVWVQWPGQRVKGSRVCVWSFLLPLSPPGPENLGASSGEHLDSLLRHSFLLYKSRDTLVAGGSLGDVWTLKPQSFPLQSFFLYCEQGWWWSHRSAEF